MTFSKIETDATEVGATIYVADEAGPTPLPHHLGAGGATPIGSTTGKRYLVNMLSAVSSTEAIHSLPHEGRVDVGVFIDFCEWLLHDDSGTVFLVVDNPLDTQVHSDEGVRGRHPGAPKAVLPPRVLPGAKCR